MAGERRGGGPRTLEEWKALCAERRESDTASRDRRLVGGAWASGTITPPPSLEDPRARIPLERARELAEEARARPARRQELLRRAVEWLDHPFPGASPDLRAAMRRLRTELRSHREG